MGYAARNVRGTHFTVFVAEDSPPVRERVEAMAAGVEGVEVVGDADSVAGAVDGIAAAHPAGLILDLRLIGGTALDVLRALPPSDPPRRIAVMTNSPTDQYRRACLAAGAEYMLDKSSEFERLPEILREWTQQAHGRAPYLREE